jgi:Tat protein translocase TatB subunit
MNLGMPEMIFIFLMALMVFGPRRLPELARQFGKIMAEFKRASNEFKYQLESEIATVDLMESQAKQQEPPSILPPPEPPVPNTVTTEATTGHAFERPDDNGLQDRLEPEPMNADGLTKEPNA